MSDAPDFVVAFNPEVLIVHNRCTLCKSVEDSSANQSFREWLFERRQHLIAAHDEVEAPEAPLDFKIGLTRRKP